MYKSTYYTLIGKFEKFETTFYLPKTSIKKS
jgi:hypothetical protein